jgi:hypothetical protein
MLDTFSLENCVNPSQASLVAGDEFSFYRGSEITKPVKEYRLINSTDRSSWYSLMLEAPRKVPSQGIFWLNNIITAWQGHVFSGCDNVHLYDNSENGRLSHSFLQEYQSCIHHKPDLQVVKSQKPGIFAIGPGYKIWGHWLVDYLPRLYLASSIIGRDIKGFVVPLPSDTPKFAIELIGHFLGISSQSLLFYEPSTQAILFQQGLYPTFPNESGLHSLVNSLYEPFRPAPANKFMPIYVSRRCIGATSSKSRIFYQRKEFELALERRGFAPIFPEKLSIADQLSIFGKSSHVVGEFGSGMHTAIFSNPSTVVGVYQFLNQYQLRIAELCSHKSVWLFPSQESPLDSPTIESTVDLSLVDEFIQAVLSV